MEEEAADKIDALRMAFLNGIYEDKDYSERSFSNVELFRYLYI
jgi:hypothetical protein